MSDSAAAEKAHPPIEHHPVHHRVHVLSVQGKPGESVSLPVAFSAIVRPELIQRAVNSAHAARRQPHGTSPTAGVRHSVEWSGKGKGVARTPRLMDGMRGAQAPNTVGGRPTHPPTIETIWKKKINVRERQLAFASALAATREGKLAKARGHRIPEDLQLPVVLEDKVESVDSTGEAYALLSRLKLDPDIQRARDSVHIRSGRGKRRGRLRRESRSVLLVTSAPGKALGFRNLSGVDVVAVGRLGTEDLAPGGQPGRLTVFSHAALSALSRRLSPGEP